MEMGIKKRKGKKRKLLTSENNENQLISHHPESFHLHLGLPSKMTKPSLVHPPNLDTLMAANEEQEEIIVPPEVTQDRVFFIFNNLSQMNMQQ